MVSHGWKHAFTLLWAVVESTMSIYSRREITHPRNYIALQFDTNIFPSKNVHKLSKLQKDYQLILKQKSSLSVQMWNVQLYYCHYTFSRPTVAMRFSIFVRRLCYRSVIHDIELHVDVWTCKLTENQSIEIKGDGKMFIW